MKRLIKTYLKKLSKLRNSRSIPFDSNMYNALPVKGGVYRIFDSQTNKTISIWVGKTNNFQTRIYRAHLMGNRGASSLKKKLIKRNVCSNENSVKKYLKKNCLVQFLVIEDKNERSLFEHFAIAILRPKFND